MSIGMVFSRLFGNKRKASSIPKNYKEVTPKWHSAAFLICDKCGSKLAPSPEAPNPSGELRKWLKEELKTRGAWGKVRVLGSSCMDICPKGSVTVGILSDLPREKARCLIIDPQRDKNDLLSEILEYSARAPQK